MSEKFKRNKELIKCFMPYLAGEKKVIAADMVFAALSTLCEIALPLIAGKITDKTSGNTAALTVSFILIVAVFYLLLTAVDAGSNYYMAYRGHVMGTRIENRMRNDLFSKLQDLPFSFYDNAKVGQLMSRLTADLFDIAEFAHHFPEELFITVLKVGACFIIFSNINIGLFAAVIAVFPLMLLITKKSRTKMRDAFKDRRVETGEINARAEDSLLGIRVVKSFANEGEEKRKFFDSAQRYYDVKSSSYRYMAIFHVTTRLFNNIMNITVIVIGAFLLMKGKLTPGGFTTSLLMVNTLVGSIRRILDFSEQFNNGITGIERFKEIMDEKPEPEDDPDAVEPENIRGDIELRDVRFKYAGTNKNVLDRVNIKISSGDNLALVGPSGSGKTTVCNLIPRFYEIDDGEILIDGMDFKKIKRRSLRDNIGIVQQDVYLFSGTVKENIAYADKAATDEQIIAAAKKANAHDFIMELPNGYDTYVGERGVKLSGGQKQRISIARVFLKDPPILILDEATSALDNESERIVQQSLEELSRGRTTLTIAHRLTTIINASRILVLTEDGIAEQGTHRELIEKNGLYASMYKMYRV